jgi:hypothetical protein
MGFGVDVAPTLEAIDVHSVRAAARVLESPPPRRIELWFTDASHTRLDLRAVIELSSSDDEETQTVRASEQLRALLQPLQQSARPSPEPPPQAPEPDLALLPDPLPVLLEPPPRAEPAPRFAARAGISLALPGSRPGVDLDLGFRWLATRVLGLGVVVGVPLLGSAVSATQGSASLSASLFGAELSATFLDLRVLRFSAIGGVSAAWLRSSGSAKAPYISHTDSVVTALPTLGLEVAARVATRVHLYAEGRVGVSLLKAEVSFAGQIVSAWAQPLGLVTTGVDVAF